MQVSVSPTSEHLSFMWRCTSNISNMGHECLKSSLAFRKPATAVASRRPARADGPKVGLDATMGMKASAFSDARGALCSTRCQPSAAESCSPTATPGCSMLLGAAWHYADLRLSIGALSGWY